MSEKLWGGRFEKDTDAAVEKFNSIIDVDRRLYARDIDGSIAHLKMLAKTAVITAQEAKNLTDGLQKVKTRIENGEMVFSDALEDIHMHVETALGEVCGDTARKLHTARSRNDQIALDIRMYLKDEIRAVTAMIKSLQEVLLDTAREHITVVMPGYTHLQRAQPVLFSHHLMAYFEMFKRDRERFDDCFRRTDAMPLGTAALAGTTYPVDREYTKELLGFSKLCENSMDAVSDRDFIVEFISAASVLMIHLSRLSEELILWSSFEFSFITISDAFTTGSSIMPQKKNPDAAELVRGKTGRVAGNLVSIITLLKSLPLAYNKDMQEDKEPLFDTVDTVKACLDIYIRMLPGIEVHAETMRQACSRGFLNATELADYLAVKGMPFREAHAVVGKTVARAAERGKELQDMTLSELRQFSDRIENDVFPFLDVDNMIERRVSSGGTARENVRKAIEKAAEELRDT